MVSFLPRFNRFISQSVTVTDTTPVLVPATTGCISSQTEKICWNRSNTNGQPRDVSYRVDSIIVRLTRKRIKAATVHP